MRSAIVGLFLGCAPQERQRPIKHGISVLLEHRQEPGARGCPGSIPLPTHSTPLWASTGKQARTRQNEKCRTNRLEPRQHGAPTDSQRNRAGLTIKGSM
jgi:hypothetical protein